MYRFVLWNNFLKKIFIYISTKTKLICLKLVLTNLVGFLYFLAFFISDHFERLFLFFFIKGVIFLSFIYQFSYLIIYANPVNLLLVWVPVTGSYLHIEPRISAPIVCWLERDNNNNKNKIYFLLSRTFMNEKDYF